MAYGNGNAALTFTDYDRDVFLVAMTAFAEARSEGVSGIRAQIHSVINRYREKDWDAGKSLAATVLKPYAYSAWNSKDPNRVEACSVAMNNTLMQMCINETEMAISGRTDDPTGGATHYYVKGSPEPDWVTGAGRAPAATFTVQIGRHLFYKDVK